jgi:hypothetical protein
MKKPHRCLLIANLLHMSLRWPALGGGLIASGWDVTVVTTPLGDGAAGSLGFPRWFAERARIVETAATPDILEPIRRLLWVLGLRRRQSLTEQVMVQMPGAGSRLAFDRAFTSLQAIIGWPDVYAPWKRPALAAARAMIRQQPYDVMVSTSPYPTSHAVAAQLKRENPSLRWVADFRDLWSQNHNYEMPRWRQRVDAKLERRMMARADVLVTTATEWAEQLRALHDKPVTVVRNAFVDYEALPDGTPSAVPPLTILYTGVRYPGKQLILPVLEAIAILADRGEVAPGDLRLRVVGPFDAELADDALKLGVEAFATQEGPVGRREAQRRQRQAHVLLYLGWEDPAVDMVSSLKFWEYLASGRPVPMAGGNPGGTAERVLVESNAGVCARTAANVVDALRGFISEFKRTGATASHLNRDVVARHGISVQVRALERVLDSY